MTQYGLGFVIFPTSWGFGILRRPSKSMLAIGPFRFVLYYPKGSWSTQKSVA